MADQGYPHSFAVFPFLKTSGPVSVGGVTFRSTDDTAHLGPDQAERVAEIARTLFLQDDLRIRSASYATLPFIDLDHPASSLEDLERLQAMVAYCYASPHEVFGDPFLRNEHASLVIFSPAKVSIYLIRPEHHVERLGSEKPLVSDDWGFVEGYRGLYNFKHHFWVAKGSHLYPPVPHLTLNISQDLSGDLGQFFAKWPHYQPLLSLMEKPVNATSGRILTAIRWFNAANSLAADEEAAIVSLAVAFETLLGLPEGERRAERLKDAVSLLLGRIPRLDSWVQQFYKARSDIVHEGRARRLRFVASDSKTVADEPLYHSLLSFGRQVFQFCVGSLLFGAGLAAKAGLEEKLVTNQERLEQICKLLDDRSASALDRLQRVADKVAAVRHYRFVWESNLRIETILASARLAARALLECDDGLDAALKDRLEKLVTAKKSTDHYEELDTLRELYDLGLDTKGEGDRGTTRAVTFQLIDVAWGYVFMHYYWVKEYREKKARGEAETSG